jgi:hypothetical protein
MREPLDTLAGTSEAREERAAEHVRAARAYLDNNCVSINDAPAVHALLAIEAQLDRLAREFERAREEREE